MIYIIKTQNYVKIGYSKNPERRIKELQYMCPTKLKLICTFEGNLVTEKALHNYFDKYRVSFTNEWFKLEKDLNKTIKYWCEANKNPNSVMDFLFADNKKRSKQRLQVLFPEVYNKVF